jgi:TonB-dependent receptor
MVGKTWYRYHLHKKRHVVIGLIPKGEDRLMIKSKQLPFSQCRRAAALLTSFAAATAVAQTPDPLEEVVVTGFRASLQSSTEAKRESIGFVDSIFAEDIGKFPDTNIAESFNRIPGVNISRDITGEGLSVAIRGLNTNFTRVLLNNAPVAIASTGQDNASANREVDLDMFPSELFSQLTVAKTASAEMVEGGAAGTVNMRMARPFDHDGMNLTYQIQGIDNSLADSRGMRGSLIASSTWGSFGALVGVAGVQNEVAATGFETIGWTSMNLTPAQCGGAGLPCNSTGGAGAGPGQLTTVPGNPSTIGAGLTPGATVDQAFLLAQNPGRTIQQIDNAIFPRLGRPMFDVGEKNRYNGVVSLEFRPTDDLNFFLDSMYGKKENDLERVDLMWGVRRTSQGGLVIPQNMQVDRDDCSTGCVVTSATFANSQFLLEYRPYFEETKFWGTNPGMTWLINDKLSLDVQGNYTHSDFYSEVPTVLMVTEPSTVTYTNTGGNSGIVSSVDLNNPANYKWLVTSRGGGNETGRTDLTAQRRETETKGGRFSVTWGGSDINLKVGAAFDEVSRDIIPLNNTQQWQNAVCGGNPATFVPAPNSQPPCRGLTAAEVAAANAANPAAPPFPTYNTYGGSLIPNSAVPNYLQPTSYGFVTVDWKAFARDSNYDAIRDQIGQGGATPTTANWGQIIEEVTGGFMQLGGDTEIGSNRLKYNVGFRYIKTDQSVTSRLTAQDTRNVVPGTNPPVLIADGTRFADVVNLVTLDTDYKNFLPSANVAWNVTDAFIVRGAVGRTMTRANPSDMLLGLSIPNADVSQVNLGNPELDPYLSDNFDLGFEYYTGREGYFGVAAFRKVLEGFTTRRSTIIPFSALAEFGVTLESLGQGQRDAVNGRGGNNAPVTLNQTVNASGQLTVNGLEFNWVQPLDFLLERIGLDGLGFTANYTIIDQKGEGAAPAIAIGVPPETYNATLYYEKRGVSARVSVTSALGSQGSGPSSNQSQITGAELFGEDYTQWDFSSSFDFSELFGWSDFTPQLTIDVINIDDQSRRSYFQYPSATFTDFDSGRTVMVGLRGRF